MIRTKVLEIRETGRAAQGVRLIKLDEGDSWWRWRRLTRRRRRRRRLRRRRLSRRDNRRSLNDCVSPRREDDKEFNASDPSWFLMLGLGIGGCIAEHQRQLSEAPDVSPSQTGHGSGINRFDGVKGLAGVIVQQFPDNSADALDYQANIPR